LSQSILLTEDKSHTLYSEHFGAHYHSIYGALEESMHVFISAGLYHLHRQNKKTISIFEMGFGTGLNALLTYIESLELQLYIEYDTLESHPISTETRQALNYGELIPFQQSKLIFDKIHDAEWESTSVISESFKLRKIKSDILNYSFNKNYDLIYYDAFAPSCQELGYHIERLNGPGKKREMLRATKY